MGMRRWVFGGVRPHIAWPTLPSMPNTANLTKTEQHICTHIAGQRDHLIKQLGQWVAIPTGFNNTPGLDELRGIVTSRLEALGARTDVIPGEARPAWLGEGRAGSTVVPPVAVCRRETDSSADGQPKVLIAGHLDTVFDPNGAFQKMTISTDGKTGNGPGVVDMKGGILIAITALEVLEEAGVKIPWTFMFNSDEETGSFHSDKALRAQATKHTIGLATEPGLPGGGLAIARKGSGQFLIEARGRSAHAGRAFFEGTSAVYALADILTKVGALSDEAREISVNIGPLKGGEATNIVPDYAAAWGNARYPTNELGDDVGRAIDALATPTGAMPEVIVHRIFSRPAKPEIPESRALAEQVRAVAADLGETITFASTGGVCDGNNLQDAGLPTIDTLGVRGGDLHKLSEWIELDSLVDRAQLFACLMLRLHSVT